MANVLQKATVLAALVLLSGTQIASAQTNESSCNAGATFAVANGYAVQNNAYNLQNGGQECIYVNSNGTNWYETTNNSVPTDGAPGAYPSIYAGCHWGTCTSNQHGMPMLESSIATAPSAWSVTPSTNGAWDVSYDIWFNPTSTTTNNSTGLELMIWLNDMGGVEPAGSLVVSNISINGATWNIWRSGTAQNGGTISYVRTSGTSSVNFDLVNFFHDLVSRGYLTSNQYLIDVEAGSEIWQPGSNFTTNSFSVSVSSSGGGGSSNCYAGTWCLQATLPSSPNYSNASQVVSVTTNSTYVASVWAAGTGSVQLYVDAGNWGSNLVQVKCNATSTYTQCITPAFSTGSNTTLTFILQNSYSGAGTAYLDDTFLGVSGGSNTLANPGFESGNISWSISNGSAWKIGQY